MFDLSDLLAYEEERIRGRDERLRPEKGEAGASASRPVTPEVVDHYREIAHGLRKAWIRQTIDALVRIILRLLRKA